MSDPKVYTQDLTEFHADPANPNKGTKRGRDTLAASISELGAGRSLVADANGVIVAGNKTREALMKAGKTQAVVVEVDGDTPVIVQRRDMDMSDPMGSARRYAYMDNRAGELSLAWDDKVLLDAVAAGMDLGGMWDPSELDGIIKGAITAADETSDPTKPPSDPDPYKLDDQGGLPVEVTVEEKPPAELSPVAAELADKGIQLVVNHARALLYHGDSLKLTEVLQANSVDAIVTDPPAGIGFMGKEWDGDKGGRDSWISWLTAILKPAFAALKPGGHALVWAIPRTSHWAAMAIEAAGFEIRDVHHHIFGTGFPKSHNLDGGLGTALKPAVEHWILARKPLEGTTAQNVAKYGTGALNIAASRVGDEVRYNPAAANKPGGVAFNMSAVGMPQDAEGTTATGRWPAHLSLDESAAPYLGEAAPFFYQAKASRSEKDDGLDHLPVRTSTEAAGRPEDQAGNTAYAGAGRGGGVRNFHPTVKSIDLMAWLVKLVTPQGGVVLDVFAGSGTTGVAALREGFSFIGCEQSDDYIPITKARIAKALVDFSGAPDASLSSQKD